MGTFFSRSNGVLFSKGKYVFPIDSDDIFLDSNVFSVISSIADKGNFDIVVFNSISIHLHQYQSIYSVKIKTLILEGHISLIMY